MTRKHSGRNTYERNFEHAYDEHHKRVFAFILRSVGRKELAEDILQEVFLRLAERKDLLDRGQDVRPWLYKVAASRVIDHYRSRTAQSEVLTDDRSLAGFAASSQPPEAAAANREAARVVRNALTRLPYEQRTAIMMRQYSGLTFAEVAKAMDAPLGTVLSWVHRGLVNLGNDLRKQGYARDDLLQE